MWGSMDDIPGKLCSKCYVHIDRLNSNFWFFLLFEIRYYIIIYLKLTVSRLVPDFELDESWNVSQERRLGLESKPFSAATWRTNICPSNICKFISHFSHFFLWFLVAIPTWRLVFVEPPPPQVGWCCITCIMVRFMVTCKGGPGLLRLEFNLISDICMYLPVAWSSGTWWAWATGKRPVLVHGRWFGNIGRRLEEKEMHSTISTFLNCRAAMEINIRT